MGMRDQPNIVFYFSDQQRSDTLGCYGQALPVSPNIDSLAADGVVFENAFTCQPVCGPARACIQTGLYATSNGCITNGVMLRPDCKGIAHYFNENGYDTAYIGKWHLASDRQRGVDNKCMPIPVENRAGYKHWVAADVLEFTSHGYNGHVFGDKGEQLDFVGYRADAINNYAVDYVHHAPDDKPFFLFVSQLEPHHQNDTDSFECPDNTAGRFSDHIPPGDLLPGKGVWESQYASYLACCNRLDDNVGRLVDALKAKGVWDDTIFIYCSDHGCHFKTRNIEYKRSCHDASTHIPLIIHGPGIAKGTRVSNIVSLIDIPSTLLDFAGISIPCQFQGISLKDLAGGRDGKAQDDGALIQISESQIGRAVRTKDFLYSCRACGDAWRQKGADVYYDDCLYDLRSDPYELTNLVDEPAFEDVRYKMRDLLSRMMVERAGEKKPEIRPYSERPPEIRDDGYYYRHL